MKVTKPGYYDAFHCLAGSCPDTCCGGWQVVIDEKSEAFYRQVEGELGQQLKKAMVKVDGQTCFDLNRENHCVLLTPEGLCPIQKELGEAHLCAICGSYPRFATEIGARRWIGISLSCPAAARLILEGTAAIVQEETPEPIRDFNEIPPERVLTAQRLMEQALAVLDLSQPLAHRLVRLLRLCAPFAKPLRPRALSSALAAGIEASKAPIEPVPPSAGTAVFFTRLNAALSRLESLRPYWHERLCRVPVAPVEGEALARYAVYKYFPRAALDGGFWTSGVLAVLFPVMLRAKAGEDAATVAWSLSREIEHSEENMAALGRVLTRRTFRIQALERVLLTLG